MVKRTAAIALVCLAITFDAAANAGTPLMWRGYFFLMVGNLLIGTFEGFLLAVVFGLPLYGTIKWLIAGNYFSAAIGMILLERVVPHVSSDLNNVMVVLRVMVVATFFLTILLEFPFVLMAFRKQPVRIAKAAAGFFVVQTISYVLLFGWFEHGSRTSFVTDAELVEAASMGLPANVTVYFAPSGGEALQKMSLGDLRQQKAADKTVGVGTDKRSSGPR